MKSQLVINFNMSIKINTRGIVGVNIQGNSTPKVMAKFIL